jgi:hypothetical protein
MRLNIGFGQVNEMDEDQQYDDLKVRGISFNRPEEGCKTRQI